jgi:hypothetical protein
MTVVLRMAAQVEPVGDLCWVEADELADLQVRDAPLGDEPADMAGGDAELLGELVDGEEVGDCLDCGHGVLSVVVVAVCEDRPGCQQPTAMVLYQ